MSGRCCSYRRRRCSTRWPIRFVAIAVTCCRGSDSCLWWTRHWLAVRRPCWRPSSVVLGRSHHDEVSRQRSTPLLIRSIMLTKHGGKLWISAGFSCLVWKAALVPHNTGTCHAATPIQTGTSPDTSATPRNSAINGSTTYLSTSAHSVNHTVKHHPSLPGQLAPAALRSLRQLDRQHPLADRPQVDRLARH